MERPPSVNMELVASTQGQNNFRLGFAGHRRQSLGFENCPGKLAREACVLNAQRGEVCRDWVVADAVGCEPVSGCISLETGKNTGNFAISGTDQKT